MRLVNLQQRVHPSVRVYCTFVLVAAVAFAPSSAKLSAAGVLVLAAASLAGVAWRKWLFGAIPVVSLVGWVFLLALLSGMKTAEARLEPILMFAGRVYLTYLAFCALVATTNGIEAIRALDALGLPAVFSAVAGGILRWFEVLRLEAVSANNARLLRGGDLKSKPARLGDMVRLSSAIMVRSFLRSERMAASMECRGFHGRLLRLRREPLTLGHLVPLAALVAVLAATWAWLW